MRKRWLGVVSLLLAFALVAAACGDDDDAAETTAAPTTTQAATTTEAPSTTQAETTTTAAPTTTAAEPSVAFDTGVTPAPCPEAVNEGNGCIFLGVISDLTDGPFAAVAVPLTQAQEDYWAAVNAAGGIDGWDVIISADNTFDARYDPGLTVEGFESMADSVVAMAQSLGTPQTQAAIPRFIEESVVAAPATWWSGWSFDEVDSGLILESGASYCFEAMNGVFFAQDKLGPEISYAIVAFPGDYGGDYGAGVKIAAAQLGLGDPVAEILQVPFSVGGTPDEAVATLAAAAPDVIFMVTGPTEMATITAGLFGVLGPAFKVIGAAPTWNVGLLANPDLVPLLQAVYYQTSPWGGWNADTGAHANMRAAAEANERTPNNGYIAGWIFQYPLISLLTAAIADGDLTRANLASLVSDITVDYDGALPDRTYGAANDTVERSTTVNGVDPASPDGLTALSDTFVAEITAGFDLAGPCFTG